MISEIIIILQCAGCLNFGTAFFCPWRNGVSSLQNRSGFSVFGGGVRGVPTHVPPAALDICPRKGMALSFHQPRVFFHSVFLIFLFSLSLSLPPFLSPCGALNRFYKSLWRFVESFRPRGFASTATLWGGARRSVGVELWETFGDAFIGAS